MVLLSDGDTPEEEEDEEERAADSETLQVGQDGCGRHDVRT